jgi:hypothetical protein
MPKKMNMNYENILRGNEIDFTENNGTIATACPFCKRSGLKGDIPYFNISKTDGRGWCGACGKDVIFEEYAKKAGLSLEKEQPKKAASPGIKTKQPQGIVYHLWTMPELHAHDFGNQEWLVEKLLPLETTNVISGDPQNFKTWITLELVRCVALGEAFLKTFSVQQGPVLIINEEDHPRTLRKRMEILGIPAEAPIFLLSQQGVKMDNEHWLERVKDIVAANKIKFVVVDSLIRIHSQDENSSGDMSFVFEKMRELTKLGTTVLITHHHRKESGFGQKNASFSARGSSDIIASVDCHLSVERNGNEELHVKQNKLRVDEAVKPFRVIIDRTASNWEFIYGGEIPEKEARMQKKEIAKPAILEALKSGECDREQIEEWTHQNIKEGIGKGAIGEALKELEDEGVILSRSGDKNKKFYSLSQP